MVTQTFMRPLAIVIGLVILFAGYTMITTAIGQWTLLTYDVGVVDGARIDRVVAHGAGETVDDAWFDPKPTEQSVAADTFADGHYAMLEADGTGCKIAPAGQAAAVDAYSQNGVGVSVGDDGKIAGCVWSEASGIWSAGGFQQLIRLIGQGAGLGPPIGALVALAALGSAFAGRMGQSPLLGVIILIVTFLLAGSLIDTLTPFVGNAFEAASPERYRMYGSGLGLLAKIVGNFYGVVIFSGLLYIGWMVITQFKSVSGGGGAGVFGGAGGGINRM